jgi:glycosyltransferase involved in cell wall biosynthesis
LPFQVIPIGFDASAYAPDPSAEADRYRIIFHGAMDYAPNVAAVTYLAREILPLIRAACPRAHLVLAGRDPARPVVALGELDGVTVTGAVDDMRAELTRSRVWVGPLWTGTGMKNKLLEAMAADLPCVVTPLAHQGLDVVSGVHLLVGTTTKQLVSHVLNVLANDKVARRIGHAGGEFVRPTYDWPAVAGAYEELYRTVLEERVLIPSG